MVPGFEAPANSKICPYNMFLLPGGLSLPARMAACPPARRPVRPTVHPTACLPASFLLLFSCHPSNLRFLLLFFFSFSFLFLVLFVSLPLM